ncbi:MAG: tRNA threonylcarbamoyladenosine biosynthesis protein TsaB [Patescibacteria group bacterium]|jgi:tRNA threonylcarbamoyladenosine biosynthesis protein TsaB|nr:tRNA threonylcarbamoyladenosine biosynthesis protein TsaB [Patescibacteria group bacterium]
MILALRTDKPLAELVLLEDGKEVARYEWEAHRTLAATLVGKIQTFLAENNATSEKLSGIIVFSGSGSFTGLRIGATVANALAYSHAIPVVAAEGDDWLVVGAQNLLQAKPGEYVMPTYDREPNITKPKN